MKKFYRILLFGLMLPLLTACPAPDDFWGYTAYQPILMSRSQLETSILRKEPQPIVNPGKLYRFQHYILINEKYKGVHVIDNQDPKSPQNIAFIQVPGNIDFAVKQNVLYVDNAVDLVAIDISNPQDIQVAKRIRFALPPLSPPDNLSGDVDMGNVPADAVVVGWELKQNKE
ncbi:hypothetical protein [Pontibacter harenae]|uniref:hypothetical protein n=1 Tax=Pontibacter harenae TaxID=2894083 RepID=UPI001E558541|nr:hypothetical protein [Pontibacter harenae]MCC9166262.1 hypothetical protein [Pontibacter harenae]